jgi:hypothetical protein
MREAAIIGYVQGPQSRYAGAANESELIMPVVREVMRRSGMGTEGCRLHLFRQLRLPAGCGVRVRRGPVGLATVPPIKESHVEMDAAWALYEALLKIWTGDAEVCAWSTASASRRPVSCAR